MHYFQQFWLLLIEAENTSRQELKRNRHKVFSEFYQPLPAKDHPRHLSVVFEGRERNTGWYQGKHVFFKHSLHGWKQKLKYLTKGRQWQLKHLYWHYSGMWKGYCIFRQTSLKATGGTMLWNLHQYFHSIKAYNDLSALRRPFDFKLRSNAPSPQKTLSVCRYQAWSRDLAITRSRIVLSCNFNISKFF